MNQDPFLRALSQKMNRLARKQSPIAALAFANVDDIVTRALAEIDRYEDMGKGDDREELERTDGV